MEQDTKNFILFIVLSFAIIFGWTFYFSPKPKPQPVPEGTAAPGTTASAPATPAATPPATAPGATVTAPVPAPATAVAPAAATVLPAAPEKRITVRNHLYEIEFSTRGAAPVSWKLLQYKDRLYYPYEVNLAWPPFKKIPRFESQPVNLVNPALARDLEPFRTEVRLDGLTVPDHAVWSAETGEVVVKEGEGAKTLTFTLAAPDGRVLAKSYTFRADSYLVDLQLDVRGGAAASAEVITRLSYLHDATSQLSQINFHGPLLHNGQKLFQTKPADLTKGNAFEQGPVWWAGFSETYFLSALLPAPGFATSWKTWYSGPDDLRKNKKASKELTGEIRLAPDAAHLVQGQLAAMRLYMGPKDRDHLLEAGEPAKLFTAIDYGMFYLLVRPLLWALEGLHRAVPNYGLCIILLTVALRMGIFPLTRKGQESMKEMAKLQPEIKKLQEKYPNDRMKQQEEMAALYKRHKINPLGGCLPILLQIPIFFAFYKALLISIELRHAPFFWWIQDLAGRDPLLIWPLLMGATQVLMQKLTPTTTMDPMQQKMMMFMPVIFIFLLLYFPSGLIVYWTVSNLVGIGQQLYVNRKN